MTRDNTSSAPLLQLRLLLMLIIYTTAPCRYAAAEDYDDETSSNNNQQEQGQEQQEREQSSLEIWLDNFSDLAPYLVPLFFVVFGLHFLLYPKFALRSLMRSYLEEGHPVTGQVLSCEEKSGGAGAVPGIYLVEVMYEASEHKYAGNPSMKFRNPGAWERKRFMRRYEYERAVDRGEDVVVLLPHGTGNDIARSGCPKEVVERLYSEYDPRSSRWTMSILALVGMLVAVLFALCAREVTRMDNPAMGWTVLLSGLAFIEIISFFVCADQFLKSKRRRFDSARPFVDSSGVAERAAAAEAAGVRCVRDDNPFKTPLHDFSLHARATDRQVGLSAL